MSDFDGQYIIFSHPKALADEDPKPFPTAISNDTKSVYIDRKATDPSKFQRWTIKPSGRGYQLGANSFAGTTFTKDNAELDKGTVVVTNADQEVWYIIKAQGGYYTIGLEDNQNERGRVWTVLAETKQSSVLVRSIIPISDSFISGQLFKFEAVQPPPTVRIVNVEHSSSNAANNPVDPLANLFGAHHIAGDLNQQWKVPTVGSETTIQNVGTNAYAIPGDGVVKGGEEQYLWTIQLVEDKKYKIIAQDGRVWSLARRDPQIPIQLVDDGGPVPGQYQWTFSLV